MTSNKNQNDTDDGILSDLTDSDNTKSFSMPEVKARYQKRKYLIDNRDEEHNSEEENSNDDSDISQDNNKTDEAYDVNQEQDDGIDDDISNFISNDTTDDIISKKSSKNKNKKKKAKNTKKKSKKPKLPDRKQIAMYNDELDSDQENEKLPHESQMIVIKDNSSKKRRVNTGAAQKCPEYDYELFKLARFHFDKV